MGVARPITQLLQKTGIRSLSSIKGVIPPIPTPFDKDGNIASQKLIDNISKWNETDIDGVTMIGSNGEYPLLSQSERNQVVSIAKKNLKKDKVVISGAGFETSKMTIEQTKQLADSGADALLIKPPFYYKSQMTADVFYKFFSEVADECPLPIIMYNIPQFTGVDMGSQVISKLAKHQNIIGLKESGGDIVKVSEVIAQTKDCDFDVFIGSASLLLPGYFVGAKYSISALAGVLPQSTCKLYSLMKSLSFEEALKWQQNFLQLNHLVARKSCAAGYKFALDYTGLYGGPVRAPLEDLNVSGQEELKTMLDEYKQTFKIY